MPLHDRLKNLRVAHDLTQEELAKKIYVSRQTISKWENGKVQPDLENLVLISELYGLSLDEILGGNLTDKQKPKFIVARRFLIMLLITSLLMLILQIVLKPNDIEIPLLYSIFWVIQTWCYLLKTNRGTNVYSQGEDMYDLGLIIFGISYTMIFVSFALHIAIT